jgi:hypothetical protein
MNNKMRDIFICHASEDTKATIGFSAINDKLFVYWFKVMNESSII